MKRKPVLLLLVVALCATAVFIPGCFKDTCTHSYTLYYPVYKTNAAVRANIKTNAARPVVNAGKIFIQGSYIFLNEVDKGIHVIDNSNPSSPKNIGFIDIPGNVDLAVKGNTLYADLYTDLVTLDISQPLQVSVKKIIDNAFPERRYVSGFVSDSGKVIVDWIKKDTTVADDCDARTLYNNCMNCSGMLYASSTSATPSYYTQVGTGGSMARFSIVNSSLFAVSSYDLSVYSIAAPESPVFQNKVALGWGIETIYPFKDKLFIGSGSGMFIYDITNPSVPAKTGQFSHATACDPVIADDKYAFVTLSNGNIRCNDAGNQLDVIDISSLSSPVLVKSYPMTNPHGLSKDGTTLFVCDGKDGLKVYDAADANGLKLLRHLEGFETYDVIAYNKLAIVVSKDGLRQYDYADVNNIKLLSKISYDN